MLPLKKIKKIVLIGNLKKINLDPFNQNQRMIYGPKNPKFNRKEMNKICIDKINKIGKKLHDPYKVIRTFFIKKVRFMEIQCVVTGTKHVSRYSDLSQEKNPFNTTQNRAEIEKIQPLYEAIFKNNNIKYVKEFSLGRKRIDFMFTFKNKRYGLEVKRSDCWNSKNNQIGFYKQISRLKQYNLKKVFLSDPLGNHHKKGSISLKELELFLTKF